MHQQMGFILIQKQIFGHTKYGRDSAQFKLFQ